jgi:uncharacterized protein (TIGR02284 family)
MPEQVSHEIQVLNGLIETTLDSVDGYHRAAQEAPSRSLRASFMERVGERELVVRRLQERVRQLGGEPEDEGSLLASAHRAFLAIRDRTDPDAVMAEVDHGESYLAGKWQTALGDDRLSPDTLQLITRCYESVRLGHEEWRRVHLRSSTMGVCSGGLFEVAGQAAGAADSLAR